ncbi:ComEC/Rec2 family competence protein [Roseomonas fluvialis]|uniref:Competence protein ComEC n=1 Tax=Roseomonas fluvialis TaxID=1750527 RepID=A0ABN6P3T8_9PROT|nr:ComEC/Rec2 family competence protein [Roseomonas fluvialis]BDG73322.1 competence protein ComEC [Roseomonas fluvialis]
MRNSPLSSTVARNTAGRLGAALVQRLDLALAVERGRLAPWLAVAMGAGILGYFALREEPSWWFATFGPLLVVLAWIVATRAPHLGWLLGLVGAAGLGFGAALLHAAAAPPAAAPPLRALALSGIVQDIDLLPEGLRVTLHQVRFAPDEGVQPRSIRVRLRANDPARPAPGDSIAVRALVRAPSAPAYPGAWDFQRAAFFAGQGGAGFAIGPATVTPGAGGAPPLAGLRATIEARVTGAVPGAAGAVAAAMLTGGQSAIPRADMAAMRDSGLAHLLSVSGLHIAIVMGVTFWVVRFLIACWRWLALRVDGKVWAGLAALGAGGFYMLLTGSQVPMQRSFAMAALVTLALLSGRHAITMRGLALAAAAVMLLAPDALLGPSFQMSFAAVLALVAGWEAMRGPLRRLQGDGAWWRRGAVFVVGLVGTSVLAGLATAPFGLAHFGRLQWFGVAANAVAVPLTSVLVMPAAMLAALLMPVGLDGPALAVLGWGCGAVLAVAREVASWPGAASTARPIPPWGLLCFAFGLLWLCLWRARWRWAGVPLMCLGLASPALHRPPDLLVSGDARLVGFAADGAFWLQRQSGASNLVRESWLRAHGLAQAQPFPREGEAAGGAIACRPGACTLRATPDGPAAALLRGDPPEAACGRAAVVVSAEPVRGRCAGSQVVDRFAVWRNGPHAVWLAPGGAQVVSDRAFRGARPWVPPPPSPRARDELPPAPVE